MTDMGFDGAMYDGTDGSIDTFERLGDGWMPFAHLPSSTDADLADQAPAAKRILEENRAAGSLKKRAKLSANEQWNVMLERLLAFRDRFGHCNVPKRYLDDPQLYVVALLAPFFFVFSGTNTVSLLYNFLLLGTQRNVGRYSTN